MGKNVLLEESKDILAENKYLQTLKESDLLGKYKEALSDSMNDDSEVLDKQGLETYSRLKQIIMQENIEGVQSDVRILQKRIFGGNYNDEEEKK